MGSHKQNKISMDVAANSSSLDSLSFTSLVCIDPNQQSKSLTASRSSAYDQSNKDHDDHEFEFKNPHISNEISRSDMVNSGSHLRPLEFLLKSTQPLVAEDKRSRPQSLGCGKSTTMVSRRTNEEAKNGGKSKRETNGSKSWFQSFVSPCRGCRVVGPTSIKEPAAARERIKLH